MHWDTNWAFTNGETRFHLVRTLDKVLFWIKKNEGPDTRSKIAHNVTRNTFFSRAICVLILSSSRCRTMHECLISDVAFRLTGYWPIKLHYRSPFVDEQSSIKCLGLTVKAIPFLAILFPFSLTLTPLLPIVPYPRCSLAYSISSPGKRKEMAATQATF